MAYRNLDIGNRGAVRIITVNRPDKLNALNRDTLNELTLAFAQAAQDDAVRAVVLAGAGDKAFVAGADIAEMNGYTPVQAQGFSRAGQRLMSSIERLGKPVVARIQGFALGGGMELAMACDLVIASEKARFGQPEINLGIIPGFGGTQRLARRIGAPRAREMIYGGDMIDAETARQWGLVNRVVKPEELLGETRKLAAAFAAKPPVAIAQAKLAIRHGLDVDLESGLRLEAEAFAVTFSTTDRSEGMTAFLSTRPAKFTGR
jgi:enoyl-CoA hydratase